MSATYVFIAMPFWRAREHGARGSARKNGSALVAPRRC